MKPWQPLEDNEKEVSKLDKTDIKGEADETLKIEGNAIIGEGTKVLPGVFIEGNVVIGKNCKIGPNCYLRGNTKIGDNCHIGQAVEIKNCLIGNKTNIPHLSYVGDSIIGDNCNLGAGTIVANLRHDGKNVKIEVDGKLIDTGRRKLGAIIGDNVKTGINTSIYPGRILASGTFTLPGEEVKENKK